MIKIQSQPNQNQLTKYRINSTSGQSEVHDHIGELLTMLTTTSTLTAHQQQEIVNHLRIAVEGDYQFDKVVFCELIVQSSSLLHVIGTILNFNDEGSQDSPEHLMKIDAVVILLNLALVPKESIVV
jgi:hypothetical protein